MKRLPLLLFLASAFACAQTQTPVSFPVTLSVQPSAISPLLITGPQGPQGIPGVSIQGPAGPQGLAGPPGPAGTGTAQCPTSTIAPGSLPMRLFNGIVQPGDSLTKSSGEFQTELLINADQFTQVGQTIHVLATVDGTGVSGTPQLEFMLDGATALSTPNGPYIGSSSPVEFQEEFQIVAQSIGANGTVQVYGKQIVQAGKVSANQQSAGVTLQPLGTYVFNTTISHTVGFETGSFSYTGTLEQTSLAAFFWP